MSDLPRETPATFGPAAVIVAYDCLEAVVDWINGSPWSLMTTILGSPTAAELRELSSIDTTVISINEAVVAAGDATVTKDCCRTVACKPGFMSLLGWVSDS